MKPIVGYPGYFATEDGRIWSSKSNKFLKTRSQDGRYLKTSVCVNGKRMGRYVHVLVALAYYKRPRNTEVNHIDNNKMNNHYKNLEWISHSKNVIQAWEVRRLLLPT